MVTATATDNFFLSFVSLVTAERQKCETMSISTTTEKKQKQKKRENIFTRFDNVFASMLHASFASCWCLCSGTCCQHVGDQLFLFYFRLCSGSGVVNRFYGSLTSITFVFVICSCRGWPHQMREELRAVRGLWAEDPWSLLDERGWCQLAWAVPRLLLLRHAAASHLLRAQLEAVL